MRFLCSSMVLFFLLIAATAFAADVPSDAVMQVNGYDIRFRDVPANSPFATAIRTVVEAGIASGEKSVSGRPLGVFRPATPISYAELAKMAVIASGQADAPVTGVPQNTSAQGSWAQNYVKRAEDVHLSLYTPARQVFAPVSRGAAVQILMEAFQIPLDTAAPNPYSDLSPDARYRSAILTATKLGIISGDDGKTTMRPEDAMSRAEVAKIITALLPYRARMTMDGSVQPL